MGRYLNRSEYAEKRNALLLEMQIKLEKVDGDGKVLRIAALVEYFPPNIGSDRRIFEIMKRLALKHEIHFVILPPIRMLVEGTEENVRPFHGDKIVFKMRARKILGKHWKSQKNINCCSKSFSFAMA
jgi:hypothetical protein